MKKQRRDSRKALILFVLSAIILLISIILSCTKIIDSTIMEVAGAIMLFPSALLFVVSITALVMFKSLERDAQKTNEKCFQKIKLKLSNEFSEVKLKNPEKTTFMDCVPNKEIKVMARLDENDKIIFTIQVDTQVETNSYEWFSKYFDV